MHALQSRSDCCVCLFVYMDAREIQIEAAPPQKKVSLIWDFAFIQNNFNVFYTHRMVGWVDKRGGKGRVKRQELNPAPKPRPQDG